MVRVISFLSSEITQLCKMWTAYNPEPHYMRGRGPKWREKHANADRRGEPPMRIDGSDAVVSSRWQRRSAKKVLQTARPSTICAPPA